jgi:hypothetical protein
MALTKQEKEKFIKDLMGHVQASLLNKLDKVPEEWDGMELRMWIADTFGWERTGSMVMDKRRVKNYENEILTKNLV